MKSTASRDRLPWATLLLSCLATAARGEAAPLEPTSSPTLGSRLRVHSLALPSGEIAGPLSAFDQDTVTVGGRVVARSEIRRVELQVRPSRKGKWALWGAGIGVLTGLALFAIDDASKGQSPEPDAVWGALVLGPAALIGAGIGAVAAPGAQWRDVAPSQLPTLGAVPGSTPRLTLGPSKGRGLSVALTWGW